MTNPLTQLITYFKSSRVELEKVTWPSRKDTIRYSALVIAVSILTAAFFATLDYGLNIATSAVLARRAPAATEAPAPTPAPTPVDVETSSGNPSDVQVQTIPINSDIPVAPNPKATP